MNETGSTDPSFLAYTEKLLANALGEVKQADAKASLLLAASGVALGSLLSAALGAGLPDLISAGPGRWIWRAALVAAIAGVIMLSIAVYPRTHRVSQPATDLVGYFGDIAGRPRDTLEERVTRTLASQNASVVDQLYEVAHIAAAKYELIRRSLRLFAAALLLCVVALVLSPLT